MRKINLILSFLMIASLGFAQNQWDIRFNLSSVDCDASQACYDVQVRSSNGATWNLAGQNYRIYYDNSAANYVSGTSTLPADYGPYTVVQDIGPVDATSNSTALGFESTLGFLNYTMDLSNVATGGIDLTSTWSTTTNLCFDIDPSVIDDAASCIELVWGRDGLTNSLATAFVEISSWDAPNSTSAAVPVIHDDLDSSDGDQACFSVACAVVEPNITITDASVTEGGAATVQVCLSEATTQAVTISYSTASGSATQGADFTGANSSIVIPAGQTCVNVTVNTTDDSDVEGTESFTINLTNTSFGNITDSSSTVTIIDNDVACAAQAPVISGN